MRYEGLERVNPEYLAGRDSIKAGDKVDSTALSTEAQRMAVLRDFDSVGYRLDGDPEAPILTWLPREKNWGPNYLKADLGLYTSSDGDLEFALYGRHVRTWVNNLGAEWRNEVLFGGETLMSPPASSSPWTRRTASSSNHAWRFRAPSRIFSSTTNAWPVTSSAMPWPSSILARTSVDSRRRAWATCTTSAISKSTSVRRLLVESSPTDAGIVASAEYDSRDTAFSPSRGFAAALEYLSSDDSLGGDRDWQRAELGVGVAVPWRRNIWWITLAGGSDLTGDLPADRAFTLGGPQSFPGFELGEMRVGGYWTLGTSYLWNIKDIMTLRNHALYAGVQVVGGGVYDRFDDEESEGIYGGSLFLTGRTMVGR